MKDYGSEYPVIRRLPSRSTIGAIAIFAVIIFFCEALFLSRLAGVASGPAAHPAPASLAHLLISPTTSPHTETLEPPNGMSLGLLAEVER